MEDALHESEDEEVEEDHNSLSQFNPPFDVHLKSDSWIPNVHSPVIQCNHGIKAVDIECLKRPVDQSKSRKREEEVEEVDYSENCWVPGSINDRCFSDISSISVIRSCNNQNNNVIDPPDTENECEDEVSI